MLVKALVAPTEAMEKLMISEPNDVSVKSVLDVIDSGAAPFIELQKHHAELSLLYKQEKKWAKQKSQHAGLSLL